MELFWFLAGILSTLAAMVLLLPWLRTIPRLESLPSLPWQAGAGAVLVLAASFGLYHWLGNPAYGSGQSVSGQSGASASAVMASDAPDARALAAISGAGTRPAQNSGAASMNSAVASLESRLAKNGGSSDDWELLAKSYEFLNRPQDAAKARAHQLPAAAPPADAAAAAGSPSTAGSPAATGSTGSTGSTAAAGRTLSGEVTIDSALRARAAQGSTLFIVAKSVDSPGPPLAVTRASVGAWPVRFRLDDSQAMLPGRNLSSGGRVTIEARVSQHGQALPAAGDLEGSANPSGDGPVKITIDRVIP